MRVTEDLTLDSYIEIPDEAGASYGGSQMWFPPDGAKTDRTMRKGACGLIAAADILLYVARREKLSLAPVTGSPQPLVPSSRTSYVELIRKLRRRYPVFPRIGSLNIELPVFMNSALKRMGSRTRLHWCLLPTKKNVLKHVQASVEKDLPVILLISWKLLPFTKMQGVPFYTFHNGSPVKITGPIRAHFVTVTGIRQPEDPALPLFYEISSWGRKYFINSDELAAYTRGACLPLTGSLFYLKTRDKA